MSGKAAALLLISSCMVSYKFSLGFMVGGLSKQTYTPCDLLSLITIQPFASYNSPFLLYIGEYISCTSFITEVYSATSSCEVIGASIQC